MLAPQSAHTPYLPGNESNAGTRMNSGSSSQQGGAMAYSSAQIALRTNDNGTPHTIFSPRLEGPFTSDIRDQIPVVQQRQQLRSQPRPPGPIIDETNIMNRRADQNSSLYQICISLRRRLAEVPGFGPYLEEMEQDEQEGDDATDPVTLMWNMLRRGFPLMAIYNALQPRVRLEVNHSRVTEAKLGKAATFKFLQACLEELNFPPNECFLITDLYGSDTTGFVKVTKVVNRVLDILSDRGLLIHTDDGYGERRDEEPQKRTHRQNVIEELVTSERDYVQHLETLQQFKSQLEQAGAIPGDAVHDIFLNLNALLDFQRRFLIRIEQQNSLDEASQDWGQLFVQYQESFKVYEPFIANQSRCYNTVIKEWDKLNAAVLSPNVQGILNSQAVLSGFLMKPFTRLTKYPLLLSEMRRKGGLDEAKQRALMEGEVAASSVLVRANEAIDKEQRLEAVSELLSRVEDWKGHKIEHFGELMLYGSHTVLKGEGQKEVEREVRIIFDALDVHSRYFIRELLPQIPSLMLLSQPERGLPRWQPPSRHKVGMDLERIEENVELDLSDDSSSTATIRESPQKSFDHNLTETPAKRAPGGSQTPANTGALTRASPPKSKFKLPGRILFRRKDKTATKKGKKKRRKDPAAVFEDLLKSKVRKAVPEGKTTRARQYYGLNLKFLLYSFSLNGPLSNGTEFFHLPSGNFYEFNEIEKARFRKEIADFNGRNVRVRLQYKVYLFERILLCCKEINPNKPKNRLGNNKSLVDKKGKLRLQLKGRIFMQNVTDIVSFSRQGSYYIQIFWKGDPGVENFVIRFANEETMNKWRTKVETQRVALSDSARTPGQTGTSDQEFMSLKNQVLQNPYKLEYDIDEDDDQSGHSDFPTSRNASSTSLRSRSTTGGSGPPNGQAPSRVPPQRFPIPDHVHAINGGPPLTVYTSFVGTPSPHPEDHGNSYFSPATESPKSMRSSTSQATTYPFPRHLTNGWTPEDDKRSTTPAMGRAPSRDGQASLNGYNLNSRTVQRPSLPVMVAKDAAAQLALSQSRMRSVSSPDIHNPNNPNAKRYPNGQTYPSIDSVPVPPIPPHVASEMRTPVNRSANNSPTNQMATKPGAQSSLLARDRASTPGNGQWSSEQVQMHPSLPANPRSGLHHTHSVAGHHGPVHAGSAPSLQRSMTMATPATAQSTISPFSDDFPVPAQLKVKIRYEAEQGGSNFVTIVVPVIIKYRSLIDRIDSKMQKLFTASIAKGTARLRYHDSEGDSVTMGCDEDVQVAVEEWAITHENVLRAGSVPDFELYWTEIATSQSS